RRKSSTSRRTTGATTIRVRRSIRRRRRRYCRGTSSSSPIRRRRRSSVAPTGRTLHVRCSTWEQVEVFTTRKLRKGRLLSMKVPFEVQSGGEIVLGLELPNQLVVAIDGVVLRASVIDNDPKARTWIELELVGLTDEVMARIRTLQRDAANPPVAVAPPPVR